MTVCSKSMSTYGMPSQSAQRPIMLKGNAISRSSLIRSSLRRTSITTTPSTSPCWVSWRISSWSWISEDHSTRL